MTKRTVTIAVPDYYVSVGQFLHDHQLEPAAAGEPDAWMGTGNPIREPLLTCSETVAGIWRKSGMTVDALHKHVLPPLMSFDPSTGDVKLMETPTSAISAEPVAWPKEEIEPGRFVDVDPASLGLKHAVECLPRRKEPISGQTFSYVKLDDVLALIESAALARKDGETGGPR